MNEETQNLGPEKPGLDDKKRNALLRYLAILFAVAFIMVLISMAMELRNSSAAVKELNQSSVSALQKAELLQDTNRQLEKDKSHLEGRSEELEKQLADAELELAVSEEPVQTQKDELEALQEQAEALRQESEARQKAYELLLQAKAGSAGAMLELNNYKAYLGETALKEYENLIKEGD